jgi:membrane protein YqaA with SNARE-associated domain
MLRGKFDISEEMVEKAGYPLIFLLSFVGSASMFVPMPGFVAVCWGGVVLIPALVGIVTGAAETLGEVTGYAAGYGGRNFFEGGHLYKRLEGWMAHRGAVVLFLLSVIPNPIFDVAGVAAGMLRYPIWRFLVVVLVGKTIKACGIAYVCYLGVDWMMRLVKAF